jgi:hypothetical protein
MRDVRENRHLHRAVYGLGACANWGFSRGPLYVPRKKQRNTPFSFFTCLPTAENAFLGHHSMPVQRAFAFAFRHERETPSSPPRGASVCSKMFSAASDDAEAGAPLLSPSSSSSPRVPTDSRILVGCATHHHVKTCQTKVTQTILWP